MRRRKFLIGAGSIAAGSAAAMGSGAFAVEAVDREATGTIAGDNDAYLKLIANSPYSEIDPNSGNDELQVTLDRLNSDSTTEIDDIFFIRNDETQQGSVDVQVDEVEFSQTDVTIDAVRISSKSGGVSAAVGTSILNNRVTLPTGGQIGVAAVVTISSKLADGTSTSGTFHVDAA